MAVARNAVVCDRASRLSLRTGASGLTLLGARYCDEVTGTFVSVDPHVVSRAVHAYVYSANNPMTWADPSGLKWGNPFTAVAKAAKSVGSWVKRNQAEIVGAVAGTVVFAGCMAGVGLGRVWCGSGGCGWCGHPGVEDRRPTH